MGISYRIDSTRLCLIQHAMHLLSPSTTSGKESTMNFEVSKSFLTSTTLLLHAIPIAPLALTQMHQKLHLMALLSSATQVAGNP